MLLVKVCFTLLVYGTTILAETGDDVNAVLTDVFTTRGYNKKIRPIVDQTQPLHISADFYLNSIIDFDEKTESIKTAGFLSLNWQDQYFTWTPASFNNTQSVFVPQEDIWKPDISLTNSYKTFTGLGATYLNLVVDHDGSVTWSPFQVLESTCSITITYFPFDVQTCEMKFSAWSYTKNEVEINEGTNGIQLSNYQPSAAWDIAETSAREINTEEAAVVFTIRLKRKPRFYIINVIIPIVFLSFLNVCSFLLPSTSGEKASYAITVVLSLAVFLTIVSQLLPNNSENTSLLSTYIMLITGLSAFISMLCIMELRLQSWHNTEIPVNKLCLLFVTVSNFIKCQACNKRKIIPEDDNVSQKSKEETPVTWLDVINAMDFIFFIFSSFYTFICTFVIGIVAVHGDS
ncbi:hypothetical protein ACF0H5_001331 [Mactra antiquata]